MHFIKLDAIGSTNDFLKDLARSQTLQNFTVVTAETQTSGRGQRGATWKSESGKNLTMSVFVATSILDMAELFTLNAAVAVAIVAALEAFEIPELSIKWPNDILSGKKKIGGILIENNVKSAGEVESVIGIGLNVNQASFDGLPNAGSLFTQTQTIYDKNEVLMRIVFHLQNTIASLASDAAKIWDMYDRRLFRKGIPTAFQSHSGTQFMGIIVEAAKNGMLRVQLEDGSVQMFGIKEISMLY